MKVNTKGQRFILWQYIAARRLDKAALRQMVASGIVRQA